MDDDLIVVDSSVTAGKASMRVFHEDRHAQQRSSKEEPLTRNGCSVGRFKAGKRRVLGQ
jgi:hypothetical protein